MRIARLVLGGLVGLAVLMGGAVLVYVLTRPRANTISVTPLTPDVPIGPQPARVQITQRAERAVQLDREMRQEPISESRADGAQKRKPLPEAPDTRLDLNAATVEQLEALPRIGPILARRIVAYREDYGYFNSLDELQKVSGIGPSIIEAIKGAVRV